jgi:hypothetical protein
LIWEHRKWQVGQDAYVPTGSEKNKPSDIGEKHF